MQCNPFRRPITGFGIGVGLAIGVELMVLLRLLSIPSAVRAAVAMAIAALGAVALISLVVLVFWGRSYAAKIAGILGGAYWAHWRYDLGEWERFSAHERRRTRQMAARAAALLAVAIVVVVAFSATSDLGLDVPNLIYLVVLAAALLIGLAHTAGSWSLFSWRRDPLDEAYIAPLAVYRPDGYIPLRARTRTLLRVAVVPGDPAALVFSCRDTTLVGAALVRIPVQIAVPIPLGREDEARALARRFMSALPPQ